ncbi:MAG: sugar transferase [Ruminococcaceae bacterium]|nr:sugar transferase [Oscillospiraceae bacterium]
MEQLDIKENIAPTNNDTLEQETPLSDAATTSDTPDEAKESADADQQPNFEGEFDYRINYPDEYYDEYIKNFEHNTKKRTFYRFVKRSFDIVASLIMLLILAIPMIIIAIIVKCDSPGKAVFNGERVGRHGKKFKCYKFRTMRTDAPKDCPTSLLDHPEQYQTKVGRTLRRFSLDELPQLFCVLSGSMSFIGYRPLVPTEVNCNEMRRKLGVFAMRPGISGYSQVHGRDDVYYKNKAIMDAHYVKDASIGMDIKLMFQTVGVVLKREGNDDEKKQG